MSVAERIAAIKNAVVAKAPTAGRVKKKLPSRLLPCVDLGARVPGEPCGSQLSLCKKHSDITTRLTPCSGAARCCATCRDYRTLDASHPNVNASHAFAASIPHYWSTFSGRGVVIVGGGKYWPSAYVTVKMLRHVGCALPAQVWYLGEPERDAKFAARLRALGAEVIDAVALAATSATRGFNFPGKPPFGVKTFAALHSPYEEVLVLDADCYPCADPTILFNDRRYRETGGVFWPDLPQTNAWTRWAQWGVDSFGPNVGWEVGQYVIHKRHAWRQIQMARWYDDHGDWCYGYNQHHDHGDKGSWRVGWARFRTEPAFYSTTANWRKIAFVHPGPDGTTPMFVHRCRSKFTINSVPFSSTTQTGHNVRANLPLETEAFAALAELR